MKYSSFIYPVAIDQLREIAEYLEFQRTGYGKLFLHEFYETLDYLEQNGHSQAKKRKEFRQVLIGRFHVLAIYELKGLEIHIYNIIHTSRKTAKRYRKK